MFSVHTNAPFHCPFLNPARQDDVHPISRSRSDPAADGADCVLFHPPLPTQFVSDFTPPVLPSFMSLMSLLSFPPSRRHALNIFMVKNILYILSIPANQSSCPSYLRGFEIS
jgi:hypothetical protein